MLNDWWSKARLDCRLICCRDSVSVSAALIAYPVLASIGGMVNLSQELQHSDRSLESQTSSCRIAVSCSAEPGLPRQTNQMASQGLFFYCCLRRRRRDINSFDSSPLKYARNAAYISRSTMRSDEGIGDRPRIRPCTWRRKAMMRSLCIIEAIQGFCQRPEPLKAFPRPTHKQNMVATSPAPDLDLRCLVHM